jgi:hypothetical protein
MQDKLSMETYEVIFFKLLEGEYSPAEEALLLKQIEVDPFYAFEWENWSKTVLEDESVIVATQHKTFFDNIKAEADLLTETAPVDENKNRIVGLWFAASIAASVVLILVFFFSLDTDKKFNQVVDKDAIKLNDAIEKSSDVASNADSSLYDIKTNEIENLVNASDVNKSSSKNDIEQEIPYQDKTSMKSARTDSNTVKIEIAENGSKGKTQDSVTVNSNEKSRFIKGFDMFKDKVQMAVNDLRPDTLQIAEAKEKFQRKITITRSELSPQEIAVTLSSLGELADSEIRNLLKDKKIRVVRSNDRLYVKLVEDNQEPVFIALNTYVNNYRN